MIGPKGIIIVNIYGAEYPIKGDENSEYIRQVAQYVDTKMREVNSEVNLRSIAKVAILAGMNIADELFKERGSHSQHGQETKERISNLIDMLSKITE